MPARPIGRLEYYVPMSSNSKAYHRENDSLLTISDRMPPALRDVDQWVPWRYLERDGKWVKAPHTCTGTLADVTNPRYLSSFEAVLRFAIQSGFFLGFVFTPLDPFCGIDL